MFAVAGTETGKSTRPKGGGGYTMFAFTPVMNLNPGIRNEEIEKARAVDGRIPSVFWI